ncbi:MAG: hypothetical protein ACR2K6_10110 [Solirubrobacterales bacterium]
MRWAPPIVAPALAAVLTIGATLATLLIVGATEARAGFDLSHAVRTSCEPLAPPVTKRDFRGRYPGASAVEGIVLGCPDGTGRPPIQVALASDRNGRRRTTCVLFSARDGFGHDVCESPAGDAPGLIDRPANAVMLIRSEPDRPLVVVGLLGPAVDRPGVGFPKATRSATLRPLPAGVPESVGLPAGSGWFTTSVSAANACRPGGISLRPPGSNRRNYGRIHHYTSLVDRTTSDPRPGSLRAFCRDRRYAIRLRQAWETLSSSVRTALNRDARRPQ